MPTNNAATYLSSFVNATGDVIVLEFYNHELDVDEEYDFPTEHEETKDFLMLYDFMQDAMHTSFVKSYRKDAALEYKL